MQNVGAAAFDRGESDKLGTFFCLNLREFHMAFMDLKSCFMRQLWQGVVVVGMLISVAHAEIIVPAPPALDDKAYLVMDFESAQGASKIKYGNKLVYNSILPNC